MFANNNNWNTNHLNGNISETVTLGDLNLVYLFYVINMKKTLILIKILIH